MNDQKILKEIEQEIQPLFSKGKVLDYFPSSTEMFIFLGGVDLCMLMYYVGTKAFNLDEDEHH